MSDNQSAKDSSIDDIKRKLDCVRQALEGKPNDGKQNKGESSLNESKHSKKCKEENCCEPADHNGKHHLNVVIDELEHEIDSEIQHLVDDNARLKNECLLSRANMENYKKRLDEEQMLLRKYRSSSLAERLVNALDNFERALQVKNVSPEVKNFLIGFDMTYKAIVQALRDEGVEEIAVNVGDEFDHNIDDAVEVVDAVDAKPNTVVEVLQKGYRIHDRVLRHAKVKVSK